MTTNHPTEAYIAAARELGEEHARNAASWTLDGNSTEEHARRLLAMIEAGDPAAEDYLPREPNLSGEYADSITPVSLYEQVTGNSHAEEEERAGLGYETLVGSLVDALADAYEEGVAETFESTCVMVLRRFLGEEA